MNASTIDPGQMILVTGGSGFIGSHMADLLSETGYKVRIFDRRDSPYRRPEQEMIIGDLLDPEKLAEAAKGCAAIYHFGGIAGIDEANKAPHATAQINVVGTVNALCAAQEAKVKRFLFASTIYVYSNAGGFYRASKQSCERFIETFGDLNGLDYTILRFGTLYGRRAGITNRVHAMIHQALEEGCIKHPGNGNALREFIHVRDAARLAVKLLDPQYANKHYILTGPERHRISEAAEMIREMLPGEIKIEFAGGDPEGHYELTPYAFNPRIGHKLVPNDFVDFGQGLLDCINEQYRHDDESLAL